MADNVVRVQVTGGTAGSSAGASPSSLAGSSPASASQAVSSASSGGGTAQAAASGSVSVLGALAGGAAIAAGLAAAAIAVFDKVKGDFLARAGELAAYSPQIALAESQTSLKTMQADFREANELGPALAKLVTAQNEADIQLRELLLPIKKVMLEVVVVVMENVADFLKEARVFMAEVGEVFEMLKGVRSLQDLLMVLADIPGHLKQIRDEMRKRMSEESTDVPSWMEEFLAIGQGGAVAPGNQGGGDGAIGAAFHAKRAKVGGRGFIGPPAPIGLGNGMGFVGII